MDSPTRWILLHPAWLLNAWPNIHVAEKPIYNDPSLGADSILNINAEPQKYFLYTSNILPKNATSLFLKEDCLLICLQILPRVASHFGKSCHWWQYCLQYLSHAYTHLYWSAFGAIVVMPTLRIYTTFLWQHWIQNVSIEEIPVMFVEYFLISLKSKLIYQK